MDSGFGIRPNSSISQLENIFADPFKIQKNNDDKALEVLKIFKFWLIQKFFRSNLSIYRQRM